MVCYLEKKQIIKYGKKLGEKNLSPGTSGNISMRVNDGILITATGSYLPELSFDDIVLMDENSNLIDGVRKPSSENRLHVEIYRRRADINAIVHCHAPKASSFAVAHIPLDKALLAENVLYFGKIPLADYALPSSDELVQNTAKFFDKHSTVMMANHGIIIGASDLKKAYFLAETAEAYAEIYLNTLILGKQVELSSKDIEDIEKLKN